MYTVLKSILTLCWILFFPIFEASAKPIKDHYNLYRNDVPRNFHLFEPSIKSFKIKAANGVVRYRPSHKLDWFTQPTGKTISYGSLLSIGPSSAAVIVPLDHSDKPTLLFNEYPEIQIRGPVVVRLEEETFRKTSTQTFTVPDLTGLGLSGLENKKQDAMTLREAWTRIQPIVEPLAELNPFRKPDKPKPKKENKSKGKGSRKQEELRILKPIKQALVPASDLPMSINVNWKHIGKPTRYLVYIEKQEEEQEEIAPKKNLSSLEKTFIGATQESSYTVQIHEEGSYVIRVETQDGLLVSEVRDFDVKDNQDIPLSTEDTEELTTQLDIGEKGPRSKSRATITHKLGLDFPPNFAKFFLKQSKEPDLATIFYTVTLMWDDGYFHSLNQVQLVLISFPNKQEKGKFQLGKTKKINIKNRSSMRLSLTPGFYQWYILGKRREKAFRSLEKREFQIEATETEIIPTGLEALKNSLNNNEKAVLILSNL